MKKKIVIILVLLLIAGGAGVTIKLALPMKTTEQGINSYDKSITSINLSNEDMSKEEIINALERFTSLKEIDFGNLFLITDDCLKLLDMFPELKITGGKVAITDTTILDAHTEFLDLNNQTIENPLEISKIIGMFDNLKTVEMCDTGVDNETMAEIRDANPSKKVIWKVYFNRWELRTDAVAFSTYKTLADDFYLTSEEARVLKYCTDLVALDIGHNAVLDVSFLEYMPNLKILILVDQFDRGTMEYLSDLSVLKNCPKLEYLEFFVGHVKDLSFLEYMPNMKDLNISYNPISDITYLKNLPNIERLFFEGTYISHNKYMELKKIYPNAQVIKYGEGSVDHGWRTHKRYYAMRDMLEKNYVHELFKDK